MIHSTKNDQYWLFWFWCFEKKIFLTESWKPILNFSSFSLMRLLRPAYVTFLKTGWWNSNAQTSGTCRYLHYSLKVVFSWPPRSSKYVKMSSNTLYVQYSIILSLYISIYRVNVYLCSLMHEPLLLDRTVCRTLYSMWHSFGYFSTVI